MNPIRVGVIGYGLSAQVFHIPLLQANTKFLLKAISGSVFMEDSKVFPGVTKSKFSEILTHPEIDLVVICSPNDSHFSLVKFALENDKNVVCEKPLALTEKQSMELFDLANARNKILAVFHNRRGDSDFLTVQQAIAEGKVGQVTYYESNFDRSRPNVGQKWKEKAGAGVGTLYDLGSHLIDQALCLFGAPAQVNAHLGEQREGASNIDFFQVQLLYNCGLVVNLRSSSFAFASSHKTLLMGKKATLILTGEDPQEKQLANGIRCQDEIYGTGGVQAKLVTARGQLEILPASKGNYPQFYEVLSEKIISSFENPFFGMQTGSQALPCLLADAKQASKVLRVIELASLSHQSGKRITF